MNPTWKTVRVFISSTFRDMHAERDHLVTVVFPELRERVEQLGLEFFDVDLRWGVPAKDLNGETANSWEYCRQWIDRVEPFFVCLLGQRYGWVPEPRHFRDTTDRRRQEQEPRSITDLEVRHAVLDTCRKRRSYFYLRATTVPEPNAEFVDPPEYQDRLERLKTAVRHCGRPVRDYSPEWTGHGFVGLKEFGDLVLDDLWSGVLRDERYVPKAIWRQVLNTDPDTDPRYTDESQPVPRELWEKLVALAKPPPQDPLDDERQQMEAFASSRLRWFQGRTHELQQLTEFIESTATDAPRLAVVAAVPGQGKSALIAKLHQRLSQGTDQSQDQKRTEVTTDYTDGTDQPPESVVSAPSAVKSPFLITHFVGATERSATAHALVERLLGELDRSGIECPTDEQKEGEESKRDFNSLCHRLRQRLGDYAGDRRVVILLDALNQLTDAHDLHWLPARLGPSVRIAVSCVDSSGSSRGNEAQTTIPGKGQSLLTSAATPEQQVLGALERWKGTSLRVRLGELSPEDVRTIVVEYLNEYCKELDTPHVIAICRMEQARNPLYLLVMLAELRTLGGNEMNEVVTKLIASMTTNHPDTVSLFRWVLQRLEVFGAEAVRWWCLYLGHGRVGMASHELADLLARKLGGNAAAATLLIERGLRRYLLRRGGQLDFFHSQLRQAVMEQYGPHGEATAVHHEMADYFTACAKGTDPQKGWETDSTRGFAECVFHLVKAGQHGRAAALLSNFPFLLHKLRVGLLQGVFEDYEMLRCEAPAEIVKRLEVWADFFREKAHILRRGNDEWPAHKILLQLATEHADDSPLTFGAEQWLAEGRCGWLWLRRVPRLAHAQRNPCLTVLEGHAEAVWGALELADGRLASWSYDSTLRLWNSQNGACLAVFEGHAGSVDGAVELTDGRLLSWSRDRTLRLWDSQSGACLATLEGHAESVDGAVELVDDRLLSWSRDRTLRLWDSQSGASLTALEGHAGAVEGVVELADGRLLSWSCDWVRKDKALRLWDGQSGACLAVLVGHTEPVGGALVLPDGRVVSWSRDKTLRIWDTRTGECLVALEGHKSEVRGALELGDGRLLSWAEDDNTLRLWDSQNGRCLAVLEGHTAGVMGALVLPDRRLLSWSEYDNTLRLWDSQNGACQVTMQGNGGYTSVKVLSDGRLLSCSLDETMALWDGQNGVCLEILKGHLGLLGALELTDGRLLSWSEDDKTLRLWDVQRGTYLKNLEGHAASVDGVLLLADGRLLSWSEDDDTLRLWDSRSGACMTTLKGHTDNVYGALVLADGRLLSWSEDDLRVWDSESGTCLEVVKEIEVTVLHPEWVVARLETRVESTEVRTDVGEFHIGSSGRKVQLRIRTLPLALVAWEAETDASSRYLLADGTAVATQENGQVCVLKLHHGNRVISLAEAEVILVEQGKLTAISDQPRAS